MLLSFDAGIWLGKRHRVFLMANVYIGFQYVTDTFDHGSTILCIAQGSAEA